MGKPKGESKGLEFLRARRPKAMEHLLSFFGESGRHLDPRTRTLISIVTKVIAGSQRGVAQYVRKAIENGASPDEVIDAILCSYPCAGLTKVVDAIDAVLDLKLSGLEGPEASASEATAVALPPAAPAAVLPSAPEPSDPQPAEAREWIAAGEVDDIPPVTGRRVIQGSVDLALFRTEDGFVAIDNRCPHKGGSLADGVAVDGTVICPLHAWKFDLKTGRCPDRRAMVATYPVKQEGKKLFIEIVTRDAAQP